MLEIHIDPDKASNREEVARLVRLHLRELDNAVVETGERELYPAMIRLNQAVDRLLEVTRK